MPDPSTYNEKELLLRIAEGDEMAFTHFFYQSILRLRPAIGRYTNDEKEIEEILQETFIKLWVNRDSLPSIENMNGYMFKVALNAFRMRLRKEVAVHKRKTEWELQYIRAADQTFTDESRLREIEEVIRYSVYSLSGQRKKIYELSREKGMSIPEISLELGLSASTVKNTLIAALASIRAQLTAAGYSFSVACVWLFF